MNWKEVNQEPPTSIFSIENFMQIIISSCLNASFPKYPKVHKNLAANDDYKMIDEKALKVQLSDANLSSFNMYFFQNIFVNVEEKACGSNIFCNIQIILSNTNGWRTINL